MQNPSIKHMTEPAFWVSVDSCWQEKQPRRLNLWNGGEKHRAEQVPGWAPLVRVARACGLVFSQRALSFATVLLIYRLNGQHTTDVSPLLRGTWPGPSLPPTGRLLSPPGPRLLPRSQKVGLHLEMAVNWTAASVSPETLSPPCSLG